MGTDVPAECSATVRHALVTGGSSGIGHACAQRFREQGLRVTTVDIQDGSDIRIDVSDDAAVSRLADELDTVDVLVNSAGIVGTQAPLFNLSVADWNRTMTVNAQSTFLTCRAFGPGMVANGWGRIVNVASIAGKEGAPELSAYAASKAAIIALTKGLGVELARSGVLVNAVAPAITATPMNATTNPSVVERSTRAIPMGRLGQAHEVAEVVAWIASDACSFTTGFTFDVSGGRAKY